MKFGYREGLVVAVTFIIAVVIVYSIQCDGDRHPCLCGKVSGKYNITGKEMPSAFVAYCEQESHGGGWTVIQHRFDGSLSFNRSWIEYRVGFGDVGGEHWLGLEKVYQLTQEHDYELLIEMKDFHHTYKYALYNSFSIGSEAEQYRLTTLGAFKGTAGDSLQYNKGMMFSTLDRDNDPSPNNCAKKWLGGWWFTKCGPGHLNGFYRNDIGDQEPVIWWNDFANDPRGLSYTRMLIRPKRRFFHL